MRSSLPMMNDVNACMFYRFLSCFGSGRCQFSQVSLTLAHRFLHRGSGILADAVDVVTGVCALSHYNTHITCPMSSTINDSHGEPCSIICTAEISSFLHFSFHHELVKFHTSAHYSECALFFL